MPGFSVCPASGRSPKQSRYSSYLGRLAPPKSKRSNTVQIRNIAVYRSSFGIVLDTSGYDAGQCDPDCPPTYAAIQKWIEYNHGVKVSKSSVTMVKDKCGALKLDFKAGIEAGR